MKSVRIGRLKNNDICIDQDQVSRNHAVITLNDNGRYVIQDLGSTNGTYVNGQKVMGQREIFQGDTVVVGAVEVKWEAHFQSSKPIAAPQPPVNIPQKPKKSKAGLIIGIVSGSVALLAAIILCVIFIPEGTPKTGEETGKHLYKTMQKMGKLDQNEFAERMLTYDEFLDVYGNCKEEDIDQEHLSELDWKSQMKTLYNDIVEFGAAKHIDWNNIELVDQEFVEARYKGVRACFTAVVFNNNGLPYVACAIYFHVGDVYKLYSFDVMRCKYSNGNVTIEGQRMDLEDLLLELYD